MSDKVWQLAGQFEQNIILLLFSVEMGLFFSSTHFLATSVLCLVVVLDTAIIKIYLIQSHKCTSCMKFCVGGINSACNFQILQQVHFLCTVTKIVNFRGFS